MACFVSNILYSLVRSNYGFIREKKQQQIGLLWLFIHVAVIITSFCMLFLYKCYLVLHNSWILLNKFVNKTNIWIVYKTSFFWACLRKTEWLTRRVCITKQAQEEQKINLNIIIICAAEANTRILRDKMNIFFTCQKSTFFCWKESTITL